VELPPGATTGMPCTIKEELSSCRIRLDVGDPLARSARDARTQSAAMDLHASEGAGDTSGRKLRCERQYRAE